MTQLIESGLRLLAIVEFVFASVGLILAWKHVRHLRDTQGRVQSSLEKLEGIATNVGQSKTELQTVAGDVRSSQKDLDSVASELRMVQEQLSTRRIGVFPHYVAELVPLINKAKKSVVSAVDLPGYCSFSDPQTWLEYKSAIEEAITRLPRFGNESAVKLAWLNAECRKLVVKEQFDPANITARNDRWITRDNVSNLLEGYLYVRRATFPQVTTATITYQQFESIVEHDQLKIIESFGGAECKTVAQMLNLYFWIIDESEAVFAIPNYSARNQSVAFYTRDKALVDGLSQIYPRLHADPTSYIARGVTV